MEESVEEGGGDAGLAEDVRTPSAKLTADGGVTTAATATADCGTPLRTALLTHQGIPIGVGCNHEDKVVALIPAGLRRAGFDGPVLVLFDAQGKQVSRLRRA